MNVFVMAAQVYGCAVCGAQKMAVGDMCDECNHSPTTVLSAIWINLTMAGEVVDSPAPRWDRTGRP